MDLICISCCQIVAQEEIEDFTPNQAEISYLCAECGNLEKYDPTWNPISNFKPY